MSMATAETTSGLEYSDSRLTSRGIQADDWLLPEPEGSRPGTTMALAGGSRGTTVQSVPPNVSAPVRKDNLAIRLPDRHIKLLQQWECIISRVHDDCVECEMHDLTDEFRLTEYAEVYLDEFSHFDRGLLQEGAVFYWSIGHETSKSGQVRRYSEIRVRRMPRLSNLRKREIARKAEQLGELIEISSK